MNRATTIWNLFERAVERFADRTAIVDGAQTRSYSELNRRVRALGARLAREGVCPGDRVAILALNTPFFLEAYFAAAGVGAVLQPLNYRLNERELSAILADSEARLLLVSDELAEFTRAGALPVQVVLASRVILDDIAFESVSVESSDLAQLYYTSGTTGEPKGVMLTHGNVCAHAFAAIEELRLDANDRWGHFAPMFHLADAWATFAITQVGGVHVFEPRFDAQKTLDRIESGAVTITNLVPTMLAALVDLAPSTSFDPSSLRMVLSGGAPISPALVGRVRDTFQCEYVQTYGMTETSPYLTLGLAADGFAELTRDEANRRRARTGRAFSAVELEVVDQADECVPADDRSVGEIRVRGATVSPGYWRRPEETARAFRDGWLYTGDLAVIDASGSVNIVDRRTDMILSGGENVYSAEVENVLAEHVAVLEAAVFGVPDPKWGEAVRAAVVLASGASASESELIEWCAARIAGYKVPRCVEIRDELPKTGSGKIAKHELRQVDPDDVALRARMVADQLEARGITDSSVLGALGRVPRHRFVEGVSLTEAYGDHPLTIGHGQTISQPYIVALMTQTLQLSGDEVVLEVGTGSGYQTAVLAELAREVFSIEIVPDLAARAERLLHELGYRNVRTREGDGNRGWRTHAPFDAIVVTAAPEEDPTELVEQLSLGGRLIVPVGRARQRLVVFRRTPKGIVRELAIPVRFVPMTGTASKSR